MLLIQSVDAPGEGAKDSSQENGPLHLVRKGFLVAIANPKAIFLFSTLLPQFVVPDRAISYSAQMFMRGTVYTAIEWITATVYAALDKAAVAGSNNIGRLLLSQSASGSMMLFMAGALAFSWRSN